MHLSYLPKSIPTPVIVLIKTELQKLNGIKSKSMTHFIRKPPPKKKIKQLFSRVIIHISEGQIILSVGMQTCEFWSLFIEVISVTQSNQREMKGRR